MDQPPTYQSLWSLSLSLPSYRKILRLTRKMQGESCCQAERPGPPLPRTATCGNLDFFINIWHCKHPVNHTLTSNLWETQQELLHLHSELLPRLINFLQDHWHLKMYTFKHFYIHPYNTEVTQLVQPILILLRVCIVKWLHSDLCFSKEKCLLF